MNESIQLIYEEHEIQTAVMRTQDQQVLASKVTKKQMKRHTWYITRTGEKGDAGPTEAGRERREMLAQQKQHDPTKGKYEPHLG